MIFRLAGKEVRGSSAIEVVRALERDDKKYRYCGGSIRQYLSWSLNQLEGNVPPRELALSDRLDDETLALGYLFLLDECGVGEIVGELEEEKVAILHVGEAPDAVADGLRLIRQRLSDVLHSNGVTPFDSKGKPFDPTVHEAISVIDSNGDESGTVCAEERRGYFMNGKLLRPARVAVLK